MPPVGRLLLPVAGPADSECIAGAPKSAKDAADEAARGTVMSDAEWVEDVKRWYRAGAQPARSADPTSGESESAFIGYEAAHPALQARNWPDAPPVDESRR